MSTTGTLCRPKKVNQSWRVLQPGYSLISKLEADDGRWEGEGIKNGKKMDFHADPKTGVIIAEKPAD
jgi:hypothetical protein